MKGKMYLWREDVFMKGKMHLWRENVFMKGEKNRRIFEGIENKMLFKNQKKNPGIFHLKK